MRISKRPVPWRCWFEATPNIWIRQCGPSSATRLFALDMCSSAANRALHCGPSSGGGEEPELSSARICCISPSWRDHRYPGHVMIAHPLMSLAAPESA